MNLTLKKELYNNNNYPAIGKHILAQTNDELIVVYQAFRPSTASYAVKNQKFGGPSYSFNRMSWIKPNFLWMMFRSGWARKEGQERILAIWIKKILFDKILEEAVVSSFNKETYHDTSAWKADLEAKEVRLQWDPDHDPYGNPMERRAIQLGLKGGMLKAFAVDGIVNIEDITPFVEEQYIHVVNKRLDQLMVPIERVYKPESTTAFKKIGLDL